MVKIGLLKKNGNKKMAVNEKDLVFADSNPTSEVKEEGWLPYLGRQAISGLEKVPEGILATNESLRGLGQKFNVTKPIFKGVQSAQESLGIPTSEEFRRGSEKALGYKEGSFNPEGLSERILQEGISTAAQTALTGGVGTAVKTIKPIIGSAIGGNLLEELGELLELPDSLKAGMHLGGSILGSTLGARSHTAKAYDTNYKKAESAIPKDAIVKSSQGQKVADQFMQKISDYPGYEKIKPDIEKFKNLFSNEGRVDVDKAWKFKKRLNELWPVYPTDQRREFIKPMLDVLNKDVLQEYGKSNKNFLNPFLTAEQDFKAMQRGLITLDKFKDSTQKLIKQMDVNPNIGQYAKWAARGLLLGSASVGAYFDPFITGGLGTIGLTARSGNRFAKLIKNSPTAQKYAKDAIKNLAAGHVNNSMILFNQMDKELKKHEKGNEKDLVFA